MRVIITISFSEKCVVKFSAEHLTKIVLDLNSGISTQNRFARLLDTVRQVLDCDASALLAFRGELFKPLATDGLSADVLGRRFLLSEHPRLEIIARAGDVVRFPADSDLPDPYDGLIPNQGDHLKVHSCIGLPLMANDCLIGALTIDGFNDCLFDDFSDNDLRTLSALAATSLNNTLLMERLEKNTGSSLVSDLSLSEPTEMIGDSTSIQALKHEIEIVSGSGLHVLVLGDTGVGKELVAQDIHNQSARRNKTQVYINCAALPETVAESELFGHVKGAFTGAISNRKGKFETANNGTLFLDEIGELPLSIQAKLLRVIQFGDIQRIGDDQSRKVDVRIIAATNKDLKKEILEGRFRADLFHRLSVFPVHVPPLREREGDIPLLTGFFVEKCRVKFGLTSLRINTSGLKYLEHYDWPGNVRELEHAIYRAAILAKAEFGDKNPLITERHFKLGDGVVVRRKTVFQNTTKEYECLRDATDAFQRQYIEKIRSESGDNWAETARKISINSANLHRLAKRLGIK